MGLCVWLCHQPSSFVLMSIQNKSPLPRTNNTERCDTIKKKHAFSITETPFLLARVEYTHSVVYVALQMPILGTL